MSLAASDTLMQTLSIAGAFAVLTVPLLWWAGRRHERRRARRERGDR